MVGRLKCSKSEVLVIDSVRLLLVADLGTGSANLILTYLSIRKLYHAPHYPTEEITNL